MSSIRAADPLSSWSAASRLLRSFYPLITPAGQSGLASSLANSADKLPTGTRCADPCLPFIRYTYAHQYYRIATFEAHGKVSLCYLL